MTETNKLDEPLSDSDYDELEAFLGSNVVPQDCMDLEMLDGFLTAIVSGPMPRNPKATSPNANTAGAIIRAARPKVLTP